MGKNINGEVISFFFLLWKLVLFYVICGHKVNLQSLPLHSKFNNLKLAEECWPLTESRQVVLLKFEKHF